MILQTRPSAWEYLALALAMLVVASAILITLMSIWAGFLHGLRPLDYIVA